MREVTVWFDPVWTPAGGEFVFACPKKCAPPEDGEDIEGWVETVAASPHGLVVSGEHRAFEGLEGLHSLHVVFRGDDDAPEAPPPGPVMLDDLSVELGEGRAMCWFTEKTGAAGTVMRIPPGPYTGTIFDASEGRAARVEEDVARRTTRAARGLRQALVWVGVALAALTPAFIWPWAQEALPAFGWAVLFTVGLTAGNWLLQAFGWRRVFDALGVDKAEHEAEASIPQAVLVLRRVADPSA